jgi:hypothetical protein
MKSINEISNFKISIPLGVGLWVCPVSVNPERDCGVKCFKRNLTGFYSTR